MKARKPVTADNALIRLEELCARSEHCVSELTQKMRTWGVPSGDAARVMESLIERGFVDERRYAAAFVRDKYRFARWGRRKISMALSVKRIPRDIINDALDEIDEAEYAAALMSVLASKARGIAEGNTYEGRTKLFRHAVSRGFEPQMIINAIGSRPEIWER